MADKIVPINTESIRESLRKVKDPEIPVVDVLEMGIVRDIYFEDNQLVVTITPTYSGCPAMKEIETDIAKQLLADGFQNVRVATVLTPPWTTDWITPEARQKLLDYGIAPPQESSLDKSTLFGKERNIVCPQCKSANTEMISQFGSTACKALHKCLDCLEPFDYFKCI